MEYLNARKEDLAILAGMHIEPLSSLDIARLAKRKDFKLYLDKVSFFFEVEPEGIIVVKENNKITGFIIFTKDIKNLRYNIFRKGYFKKWTQGLFKRRYGFKLSIFKKAIAALFVFLAGFSKRISTKGWIIAFIVASDFRGKGIGGQLLAEAIKRLKDSKIKEVGVSVSLLNPLGKKFYAKYGFKEKGLIRESTGRCVFMSKDLENEK